MQRRDLFILLASSAALRPAFSAAQPAFPVIGYLGPGSAESAQPYRASFLAGLGDTGYVEGQNVAIEYRWADDRYDRLPALAGELVSRRVGLIFTGGATPTALAAKAATGTTPIVFVLGSDPVKFGLVNSLGRPGGNITGITVLDIQLVAKAFEQLHELVPLATTIGVLLNPNNPLMEAQTRQVQDAADTLGVRLLVLTAGNPSDIETAFARLLEHQAGALLVSGEPFFFARARQQLIALAARHAVPTVYMYRQFAAAGGLMTYGTDLADAFRRCGVYAGQILKGKKPAELPVQQSTRVELAINLKTARALGLTIPSALLARANEVIE